MSRDTTTEEPTASGDESTIILSEMGEENLGEENMGQSNQIKINIVRN